MTYPPEEKVLALDLATCTGYAVLANGIISSGCSTFKRVTGRKTIPDHHIGKTYVEFSKWLREMVADRNPEVIVFEEPMGNFKSCHARNIIVGLRGVLLSIAADRDLPAYGYSQTRLKKFASGKGNADKDLMMESALAQFPELELENHNQADAVFLLHLYLNEKEKASLS